MRIVISCMDRRLNGYLDQLNDGDIIFIRNAGANVNSLRETLKYIRDAEEILVLQHTDCGAMGVVHRALLWGRIPMILNPLIAPFLN